MATKVQIKVKLGTIINERFRMLMSKLIQTPTDNVSACHIHKVYKEVEKHGDAYAKRFNKFKEEFAQRGEDGKIVLGRDTDGIEQPDTWVVLEEKRDDLNKAMKELHDEEATINWRPLTPNTLKDIKLSAYEIDLLGELYTDENGPGLPTGLHSV